jgi:NAD(P)-dependent dehydrogenase (short-subunit alcohol dehydrogenase family)
MHSQEPTYTLVTGASSGIGRAVAERLARSRRLILHGRDLARLEAVRAACASPDSHLLWVHDFRDAAQSAPVLAAFLARHGSTVGGFVHCAGAVHVLPARSAQVEAVLESLNVNYVAAQQIVATLLRKRVNQGALRTVVVISSIWGQYGARGHSLYCAAKAALDGMVRALAVELAPDVRINSVLPGAVRTPMAEDAFADPEIAENLRRSYPLGAGQPTDVAAAVEFLMSEDARWITGQQLVVDGGRTVNMSLQ